MEAGQLDKPSEMSTERGHLVTSMRHIVLGMRLIGIPLDSSSIRSKLLLFWTWGFGITSFLTNTILNLISLAIIKPPETTANWNYFINEVNFGVGTVLGQAGLLCFTAMRWERIVSILEQFESLNIFNANEYPRIEKMCLIAGVSLIMPSSTAFAIGVFCSLVPVHTGGFIFPMKVAFTAYFFTCGVIFALVTWMVAVILGVMKEEISKRGINESQLKRLHRCYLLTDKLVETIASAFGFPLLVVLTFNVVWMINGSFMAYVDLQDMGLNGRISGELAMLCFSLIYFSLTVYGPHKIRQEARLFVNQIRSLDSTCPVVHEKAFRLMVELSLSPFRIILMGLLDVDLRLVPALIGTAITYIVVMVQFRTSEIP